MDTTANEEIISLHGVSPEYYYAWVNEVCQIQSVFHRAAADGVLLSEFRLVYEDVVARIQDHLRPPEELKFPAYSDWQRYEKLRGRAKQVYARQCIALQKPSFLRLQLLRFEDSRPELLNVELANEDESETEEEVFDRVKISRGYSNGEYGFVSVPAEVARSGYQETYDWIQENNAWPDEWLPEDDHWVHHVYIDDREVDMEP